MCSDDLKLFLNKLGHDGYDLPPLRLTKSLEVSGNARNLLGAATLAESRIGNQDVSQDETSLLLLAEKILKLSIEECGHYPETYRALARNLWFQARFKEAIETFNTAEALSAKIILEIDKGEPGPVVLPENCASVIGLTGHLDTFVKMKILNDDSREYVLFVRGQPIANKVYLNYWTKYITITKPSIKPDLWEKHTTHTSDWNWVLPLPNRPNVKVRKFAHVHTAAAHIQNIWRQKYGNKPLIKLKKSHQEAFNLQKTRWGLKKTDWFVCIHIRSSHYHEGGKSSNQNFRNSPVEDYYPAIQHVLDLGGWVFRMGDRDMPALNYDKIHRNKERLIDYAVSEEKSELLDVALGANCKLHISSNSGLYWVPLSFGKPVCMVNMSMYAGIPTHSQIIYIPKRYFCKKRERYLSLREMFELDCIYMDQNFLLEKGNIELINNTPEEIKETVSEALQPEKYRVGFDEKAIAVREHLHQLNHEFSTNSFADLGLYFAKRHSSDLVKSKDLRPSYCKKIIKKNFLQKLYAWLVNVLS